MRRLFIVLCALAVSVAEGPSRAERSPDSLFTGHVGLGLALRQLGTVGIFMHTTAHPDDENNGLLALLKRGQGHRTTLVTATRGDGGQNEIGPELFDALATLRTEELLAAHQMDGAEQFFTRAVDFGYSFSTEETFQLWGREEILGDFVRMIRTIRPDVIVALPTGGEGGGQHHQASGILTAEAFRIAADATKYPEQIKEGLRPWQARKLYHGFGFGGGRGGGAAPAGSFATIDLATYDPLLGQTYAAIGSRARSMHKCQGMAQVMPLPGPATSRYRLAETTIESQKDRSETSLFDGIVTSIASLARYAGASPPQALTTGLATIQQHVATAQRHYASGEPTGPALAAGLDALRSLRRELAAMSLDDTARAEIEYRLGLKNDQFQDALVLAYGVRLEAVADDGVVTAGQAVKVTTVVAGPHAGAVTVKGVSHQGFAESNGLPIVGGVVPGVGKPPELVFNHTFDLRIPTEARMTSPYFKRLPDAARYVFEADAPFGLPFRPTPFRATFTLQFPDASDVEVTLPVQHRYEGNIFTGEKRMDLKVVPAFALRLTPEIAIVPAKAPSDARGKDDSRRRQIKVTVANSTKGPASAEVQLHVPTGWTAGRDAGATSGGAGLRAGVAPSATVTFTREDEEVTLRFAVTPSARVAGGRHTVRARVHATGSASAAGADAPGIGYQIVEYPHIERRHLLQPAEMAINVLNVDVAPNLTIGYVMGVGDEVPAAIEQLGARVTLLTADDLAWGDLSKYDAIVTGVRAYERRADLRANNHRLLDYASAGGTLIVQYNKFEFNQAQYGPFPAKVSANRVTAEQAPVGMLEQEHPLLNRPNRIGPSAWDGWVQERGLYFLGERDPRYVDLVEMEDPFDYNKGAKRGALVEAKVGKGRWLYVGLGLWRQLPAGTPGAYELLANLISATKTAPKTTGAAPVR